MTSPLLLFAPEKPARVRVPTARADVDRWNMQALACMASNRRESRRLSEVALDHAQTIAYSRGSAFALLNLASLQIFARDLDEAQRLCTPLAGQFHAISDGEGEMSAHGCMGAIAGQRGDFGLSTQHFDAARELAAHMPDSLHKFLLYNRMGIDALNRGDTAAAPRNFLMALDMAERFGTPSHRVNILSNLASMQHDMGNDEDAIPLLGEALEIIEGDRLNHMQPLVSGNLAMCLLASGKPADALALVQPNCTAVDGSDLSQHAFNLSVAAHALTLLGEFDTAAAMVMEAAEAACKNADYEEQMHAWLVLGTLEQARGHRRPALRAFEQAHALLSYTSNPFYRLQIFRGLANLHAEIGRWKYAYGFLQQYHAHFEATSKSARDSRLLMRHLEKEMKNLKQERDLALARQAAREAENAQLETLNKELTHQIHHVNSIQSTLQEQANRDHLTGLYNRRHFETCLNAMLHESSGSFPITVVLLDLDLFKRVNDSHGHAFGDEVLVRFAWLVEHSLRSTDMLCRYGGEEFCVLLRDVTCDEAASRIAEIAEQYSALVIERDAIRVSGCTFSAGIAEYPRHGATRNELLMRADTALYAAKNAGRSCSMIAIDDV
ncbi:MAG: diguanylate cyclase [Herminiimonas sp.]|nr:diguanylate cyclase [Herminiimonas sp.]